MPINETFPTQTLHLDGTTETVVLGGRDKFETVAETFAAAGIEEIAVLGWGSQAPAQSQNLRDTLASVGSDIQVTVGLRPNSASRDSAIEAGFIPDKTLLETYQAIGRAGLVICLMSDAAQAGNYQKLLETMRPNTAFGLSHGFLVGHLAAGGTTLAELRPDVDFIGVCPKGMGPSAKTVPAR